MVELRTPGVYAQSVEPPPVPRALRTDVTGFVGIAERGPLHEAVRVTSWARFVRVFGSFRPGAYLAYTVKAFFDNGGSVAYVVRVADPLLATPASVDIPSASSSSRLRAMAFSPGVWGRRIRVGIVHSVSATTSLVLEPTEPGTNMVASTGGFRPGDLVRVRREAEPDVFGVVGEVDPLRSTIRWSVVPTLSGAPATLDVVSIGVRVFDAGRLLESFDRLALRAFASPPQDATAQIEDVASAYVRITELGQDPLDLPREGEYRLQGGADGIASLLPSHLVGEPHRVPELGLQKLDAVDEIGLVAIPDVAARPEPYPTHLPAPEPSYACVPCEAPMVVPPAPPPLPIEMPPGFSSADVRSMQQVLLEHCATRRDRFALLDAPEPVLERDALLGWRRSFDSSYGAAFYPWLEVLDPTGERRRIPPCGHVAGTYAAIDLTSGVHVAAANRPLAWVAGVADAIDDRAQADLNPLGINCIRPFPGRGIRVLGARTMSSDTNLRFVNVRRLLMLLAETIDTSLQWAVFEPHDFVLRQKVVLVLSTLLRSYWSVGALLGRTPEDGFFVRCDSVTNPADAVERGELHAIVGVSIVRPAEFVVLRIGRTAGQLEVEEGATPWQ